MVSSGDGVEAERGHAFGEEIHADAASGHFDGFARGAFDLGVNAFEGDGEAFCEGAHEAVLLL